MDRIFVQIASYRDPECQWTVKDLFEKASHPDRISVGICWQFDPELDCDSFQTRDWPGAVRRIDVHAKETKGVCWARHRAQSLWRGEEYTLLTDSHMRFAPRWDEKMVTELAECPSRKPLLSCNPPKYEPPNLLDPAPNPTVRGVQPFRSDGTIRGRTICLDRFPPHPLNGAFIVCNYVFSRAEIIEQVPYDPYLYFNQEEISLAARFWTHGWDIFSSKQILLYHYYYNPARPRPLHWHDVRDWRSFDQTATQRLHYLLGMAEPKDTEASLDLEKYGLGKERPLAEYEAYCGISFRNREVTKRAINLEFIQDLEKYRYSAQLGSCRSKTAPPNDRFSVFDPGNRTLGAGHHFPNFDLLTSEGGRVRLDYYGGKRLAICLLPPSHQPYFRELLKSVSSCRRAVANYKLDLLCVSVESPDVNEAIRGECRFTQRIASDPDCSLWKQLGLDTAATGNPMTYLLGPNLKILKVYQSSDAGHHVLDLLREARPSVNEAPMTVVREQAPVAIVPAVMSEQLCGDLVRLFDNSDVVAGPVGLGAASRVNLNHKSRTEYALSCQRDSELMSRIDFEFHLGLLPELRKLWGTDVTHRERYKICCYDALQNGKYEGHRDSSDPLQRYRRLSVSINLNDAYDGGYLQFPEYGNYYYRSAPGAALVFSSFLLHRVTPVTRGRRYTVISFAFNEEDALLRQELQGNLGDSQRSHDKKP
jgi:predicted 2-oxoglutarate/Fe(II)-dependent dioxygenase YbiX/peroxiredoxin